MKNIFSVNIENEKFIADDFVVRNLSPELKARQEQINEQAMKLDEKSKLPTPFSILMLVTFFIACVGTGGFFKALGDVSFKEAMNNAGYILYISVFCWIAFIALIIISKAKYNKIAKSEELLTLDQDAGETIKEILIDLQIPETAIKVDTFSEAYRIKNGKEVNANKISKYINVQMYAFIDNGCLMLGDFESVYAIPLNYITGIERIDKKVSFIQWNKDEAHNKGEFKQYKITQNNFSLFIKPYYAINFNNGLKDCEIIFPAYEYESFSKLLNTNQEQ